MPASLPHRLPTISPLPSLRGALTNTYLSFDHESTQDLMAFLLVSTTRLPKLEH